MSLEEIINDHASNIFQQRMDKSELTIKDISAAIVNNIIDGASLTALMIITEDIFDYGKSYTSNIITQMIIDKYSDINSDTLACVQTCIYLLYMKHSRIIKLGHYVQVSSFVDMEVPFNQFHLYTDIIDYYDRNSSELDCLSYLFN